jgi:hypothetical protein
MARRRTNIGKCKKLKPIDDRTEIAFQKLHPLDRLLVISATKYGEIPVPMIAAGAKCIIQNKILSFHSEDLPGSWWFL